jgi:hypothetical protein
MVYVIYLFCFLDESSNYCCMIVNEDVAVNKDAP